MALESRQNTQQAPQQINPQELRKQLEVYKKQFNSAKDNLEKTFKDYLPTRPLKLFEDRISEQLKKVGFEKVEYGQAVRLEFCKFKEGNEIEVVVHLFSLSNGQVEISNVHQKLKSTVKQIFCDSLKSGSMTAEQYCKEVARVYHEYWREILRGELRCKRCDKTFKYNTEMGFLPPTVRNKNEYIHEECLTK